MPDVDREAKSSTAPRPIASAVLSDGSIVETIHRVELRQTALIRWKDASVEEGRMLDVPELGRITAYSPDNNLIAHGVVLFPSAIVKFESVRLLQHAVRDFIHRFADLSDGFEEIASYYVLLSWIYDAFAVLPYLRLKGDYGSGKSRCLQVIGSLCYKPMFVSGASTVSPMFRIIDAFQGTLILDESDFRFSDERAEIVKILNNGNASGFPVLRSEATPTKEYNPRAFNVFGPKIIATRRDFDDRALESRCITEVMTGLPPRKDIPLHLPDSFQADATALRNQLLMYRFRQLGVKRELAAIEQEGLEARVAQVYGPLLSVVGDPAVRARMISIARGQTGELRAERSASLEAELLTVLFELRAEDASLVVQDVADRFATRFGTGYAWPISARWIGAQLRKRLSLSAVKSHGAFVLPKAEYAKLDTLFERYAIGGERVDIWTSGTSSPTSEPESHAA